jgi:GNAT superfamily N-acetyltransferase
VTVTYRQGSLADVRAAYDVFVPTTGDVERRLGMPDDHNRWLDEAFVADYWERRRSLFEHLTSAGEYFWLAEIDDDVVGYARAICHGGVRELTEFFVLPDHQGLGIGRELLARAFPPDDARHRVVLGTTDVNALARYLKAGVSPRFPIYHLYRTPEPIEIETDLTFAPAAAGPELLASVSEIDRTILGFAREAQHQFLLAQPDRHLFLLYRGGTVAGYGYLGNGTGPIALLDPSDFPAVLARAESEAAERGDADFGMSVPLINRDAVDYLLERGFQLEPFTVLLFSDQPFCRFENYIITSPDFFL